MRKIKVKKSFVKEFKRQLRMAISAAVGFLIAFSWKDTLLKVLETQVKSFTTMTSTLNVNFISSLIATVLGAIIIVFSSRLLKNK
jgi:hypothetical protein